MNNTAKEKKPKTMPLPLKTMRTVFWDAEGCILDEFLPQGETISAGHSLQMLKKLCFGL
jgi:Transposase.